MFLDTWEAVIEPQWVM